MELINIINQLITNIYKYIPDKPNVNFDLLANKFLINISYDNTEFNIYEFLSTNFNRLYEYLNSVSGIEFRQNNKYYLIYYSNIIEKYPNINISFDYISYNETYFEYIYKDLHSYIVKHFSNQIDIDNYQIFTKYILTSQDYLNILQNNNKHFYQTLTKFLKIYKHNYEQYYKDIIFLPVKHFNSSKLYNITSEYVGYYSNMNPLLMRLHIWATYGEYYKKLIKTLPNNMFDKYYKYFNQPRYLLSDSNIMTYVKTGTSDKEKINIFNNIINMRIDNQIMNNQISGWLNGYGTTSSMFYWSLINEPIIIDLIKKNVQKVNVILAFLNIIYNQEKFMNIDNSHDLFKLYLNNFKEYKDEILSNIHKYRYYYKDGNDEITNSYTIQLIEKYL